jgi:hypothetical protein
MSLETFDEVSPYANVVMAAVLTGNMPPWTPEPECRPMDRERVLTTEELNAFTAWDEAGRHEGNPDDYISPEEEEEILLGPPDITTNSGEAYIGDGVQTDYYHCFVLDYTFERSTAITAIGVEQGAGNILHHVLAYAVSEENLPQIEALDSANEEQGYTCFGGPGAPSTMLTGWAPGISELVLPDESALIVESGTKIVMQVHYNYINLDEEEVVPSDLTGLNLWILDEGEHPEKEFSFSIIANGDIYIDAHDAQSIHEMSFTVGGPATLVGIVPHMHILGTEISVSLTDNEDEASCLVDIPEWDFDWQEIYQYTEDSFYSLEGGEELTLRCVYDNSAGNQPVVDGEQLEPRDVIWGEGTLDEMCLAFLTLTTPYTPPECTLDTDCGTDEICLDSACYEALPENLCENYVACTTLCDEGDAACSLGCLSSSEGECYNCLLSGLTFCSDTFCPIEFSTLTSCLDSCGEESDLSGCLSDDCFDEYDAVWACLDPHLRSGDCNEDLSLCDVAFGE